VQNSGFNWVNLSETRQDLIAQLALSELQNNLKQKFPIANALYDKIGEDNFWQEAEQNQQQQAIQQIVSTAH